MGLGSKQDLHTPHMIKKNSDQSSSEEIKEGQFIRIKGRVNNEDITLLNLYASNSAVPNLIKHI